MDSDKHLIKRAVGNSAEMVQPLSTAAQKRTIDWVDPHSSASTPRKLQSPRTAPNGDSETPAAEPQAEQSQGIVQAEEKMRVDDEQARDVDMEEGGEDAPKMDESEDKTEKADEQPAAAAATNGHESGAEKETASPQPEPSPQPESSSLHDQPPQSDDASAGGQTQTPERSRSSSARQSSGTPSRRSGTSLTRSSSSTSRKQAKLVEPDYNTWKYSMKTITKESPSAKEGMSFREEMVMRTKGVNFLGNVAKLLQLPHMALYTACTFFHRFYMRHSLKSKHPFEAAAVCIFLATKVEEANRHLRDVCICLVKVAQKDHKAVVDEQSKDYWRWRDCILYGEGFFLEVLCFDLTLDSPFEHLSYYVKKLGINHVREVCKAAWGFVSDSSKTPLCLMFSTNTIALAAIYWAAKQNKTPIDQKETKARGKQHWVECFGMTRNEVIYVVDTFCDWYSVVQRDFNLATSYPKPR